MNIIGGIYKGRVIDMPRGDDIRPTSNKVREALFSILGGKVPEADVLDLFAGSGSLGLEALSRGAQSAVFVENNAKCAAVIRRNINSLEVSGKAKVIQLNVPQAIKKISKSKFDLIFMDPPYFKDWVKKILIIISQYDILRGLGLCVFEHHKKEMVPEEAEGLVRFRQTRYGDTVLSFYRR